MFELVIICGVKEEHILYKYMKEVHEDCAMIERLAHKSHCFVTVKCYEGDKRLFDRFFG